MSAMKELLQMKRTLFPNSLSDKEAERQTLLWVEAVKEEAAKPTIPGCLKILEGLKIAIRQAPRKTNEDFENIDALETLQGTFKGLLRKAREGA